MKQSQSRNLRLMNKIPTLIICLATTLTTALEAQSPATEKITQGGRPLPPPGLLLASPPDHMQWVITYTYGQDQPKEAGSTDPKPTPTPIPPGAPAKSTYTRTGEVIHEERIDQAGNVFDKWQVGKTDYIKFPGQPFWGVYNEASRSLMPSVPADMQNMNVHSFPDLGWINATSYAGSITSDGNNATTLVFIPQDAGILDLTSTAAIHKQPVIAYVFGSTRLPIACRNHDVMMSYAFTRVPGIQLLPSGLQTQIRKEQEDTAKLFAPGSKEY